MEAAEAKRMAAAREEEAAERELAALRRTEADQASDGGRVSLRFVVGQGTMCEFAVEMRRRYFRGVLGAH